MDLQIAPALIYNLQSKIYKKNNIFYEKTEMRFQNARNRIGCNCLLTQPLKEDNTCHNLWH